MKMSSSFGSPNEITAQGKLRNQNLAALARVVMEMCPDAHELDFQGESLMGQLAVLMMNMGSSSHLDDFAYLHTRFLTMMGVSYGQAASLKTPTGIRRYDLVRVGLTFHIRRLLGEVRYAGLHALMVEGLETRPAEDAQVA